MGERARPFREEGLWLAQQRRKRKLSQASLALLLDRNQTTVSQYETGIARPSDDVAARLAQVFHLSEATVRKALGLYVLSSGAHEPADPGLDGYLRLPAGVTLTEKQQRALDALLDAFLDDLDRSA